MSRRKAAPRAEPLTFRVEVAGARPATFKLIEKAAESFDLYRSSRKIGTARVEKRGRWAARFEFGEGAWTVSAASAKELLVQIGRFVLASEAREAAADALAAPTKKGKRSAEERLSLELIRRSEELRIERLDALIAASGVRPFE
jgi:hypothetical protein